MTYAFGKNSLKEIATIWPDGQRVLFQAMSYQIMDFGLPKFSGGRTPEDQKFLYSKGRRGIPDEKPVTWTLKSNHLVDPQKGYGYAFDVVPYIDGGYSWEEKHCLLLATVIFRAAMELEIPLDWGYHLWKKDMPHFQKKGLQHA